MGRVELRIPTVPPIAGALQNPRIPAHVLVLLRQAAPPAAVACLPRLGPGALGHIGAVVHRLGPHAVRAVARVDLHRRDVPSGGRLEELCVALRVAVERLARLAAVPFGDEPRGLNGGTGEGGTEGGKGAERMEKKAKSM